ncbi:MAG: phosphoribosylanthranilate isomerase, partial [Synechococcus lacustris]|nr:phosphoribosylanthranilate isomerase [Synechococcus lacustris]
PWWLAGGMGASNVENALKDLEGIGSKPYGIDASSSVENSPGNKNIEKVKILLDIIRKLA